MFNKHPHPHDESKPVFQEDPRLKGVPMDEPVFILCARDILSPALVRLWISINALNPEVDKRALAAAMTIAKSMEEWPSRSWPEGTVVTHRDSGAG